MRLNGKNRGYSDRREADAKCKAGPKQYFMDEKAQTAIEYIMIVGACIFFVLVVFMMVRLNIFGAAGKKISDIADGIMKNIRGVNH